ncbi:MAG: hypothetical protein PF495_12160 [Spirochaetales bacterium]|nr:hypothetical protein [Spirochaetales bacterium]
MLAEEFYLGARLTRMSVLFLSGTFFVFTLLWVGSLFRAGWVWFNKVTHRDRFQLPNGAGMLLVVVLWFIGYAVLLLYIETGNPELWVMGLVPFWLLFCGLILLPLTVDNRLWLPFLLLMILFVHNGVGGIGVLGDSANDYQQQKAKIVMEHAGVDDVVVTAGNPVFERYLRYHCAGKVVYLYDLSEKQLLDAALPLSGGNTYVLDDVFHQHQSLRVRFPKKTEQIDQFAEKIQPRVKKIADDEFGGLYRLKGEDGGLMTEDGRRKTEDGRLRTED